MVKKEETLFDEIGQKINEAEKGQLFGKPCFKMNKKAFICFYQDEMVFKLTGEMHSEALSLDNSQLFDPSKKKRPMKEWVQVSYNYSEHWDRYAKSAMEYVKGK